MTTSAGGDPSNPLGGMLVADKTLVDQGIIGDGSFYKFAGRRNPADAPKKVVFARESALRIDRLMTRLSIRGGYGLFATDVRLKDERLTVRRTSTRNVSRSNIQQTLTTTPLHDDQRSCSPPIAGGPVTPAKNSFIAVISSSVPEYPYVQQWSLSVQRELPQDTTTWR